jgi:rod shape-determining protein MreC
VLVLLSLVLITVYFREPSDGGLHDAQGVGAAVLRPFQIAAERVARPFRDAAGWVDSVLDAKSENEELRAENERLRQIAIQYRSAFEEARELGAALGFRNSAEFPRDFRGVAARVISHPTRFDQLVVIDAGSGSGIREGDAVVTADGLVGRVDLVTGDTARVKLVKHGLGGQALVLDRVTKDESVVEGDAIVTAGFLEDSRLRSRYPPKISIGVVTSVGQRDVDSFKQVQVESAVDFDDLGVVLVLVEKNRP